MLNIVLCCAAGMSTSLVVEKIKASAEEKNIDISIKAISADRLSDETEDFDAVLLGPQVSYLLDQIKNDFADKDTYVNVMNMQDYGLMRGENILNDILENTSKG